MAVQASLWVLATLLVAALVPGGPAHPRPAAAAEPIPPSAATLAATAEQSSAQPSDSTSPTPTHPARSATKDDAPASALAANGIPATALAAYRRAVQREARRSPHCGLIWPLLAAIGRVESDHGRFGGAILHADGLSTPRVVGIPLNGVGTALIRDTDRGRMDGDRTYDRAVGPMQFIPSTWAGYGVDANRDHRADPFNIFDAAAAAADYLCAAGGNLTTATGQIRAVLAYNHSDAYVALVLSLEAVYAKGVPGISFPIPVADKPTKGLAPRLPPVDPGRPKALPRPHRAVPHAGATATTSPTNSATTSPTVPSPSCPVIPTATDTAGTVSGAPSSTAPGDSGCPSQTSPTPDSSSSAGVTSTPSDPGPSPGASEPSTAAVVTGSS